MIGNHWLIDRKVRLDHYVESVDMIYNKKDDNYVFEATHNC